jgi:hypothetical protein
VSRALRLNTSVFY